MKFVAVRAGERVRMGLVSGERVVDLGGVTEMAGYDDATSLALADPAGWVARATERYDVLKRVAGVVRSADEAALAPYSLRSIDELDLAPPVHRPEQILCIGLNYRHHIEEIGADVPSRPGVFVKLPNALIGPRDDIVYPVGVADAVDYEVELVAVIGRGGKHIPAAEALDHVFGYTICNDVSARDWQHGPDRQLILGKGFDTFMPMGPCIVTPDEIDHARNVRVQTRVNGEVRQDANTADLLFGVAELIAFVSRICTLRPGDVIATGTPAGVGRAMDPPGLLQIGDLVECEIEGIGTIANRVAAPAD